MSANRHSLGCLSLSAPLDPPGWVLAPCRALEGYFPLKSAAHFLTKVTLNQVLLAPVVLVVVFSWNLALQGQAGEIPAKIRRDFVPSLMNGGWRLGVGEHGRRVS